MKFTNWNLVLFLFPFFHVTLAQLPSSPPPPVVNLGYAKYQGVAVTDALSNQTNTQFLGIRFAAPPTGALRFHAPQPPALTPGVQVADTQPNMCFAAGQGSQATTPFRVSTGGKANLRVSEMKRRFEERAGELPGFSEDCLFLNVHVPGNLGQKKQNLPVVFWIHGGGYVSGSASTYDGNDLIRAAGGGVVIVAIQYRLGAFGFLPGQKVKERGMLNAGLLDQQFALKWVQQHISKFGGDPQKVTIWGESAGAGSVLQHVVANGGRTTPPLFRGAITSSSFLPSQYRYNDRIPEIIYSEVVSQTNCSSAKDTLECLRRVDINSLQAANVDINNSDFFGTLIFVPVVDGTFITDRPTELLKRRKINGEILYSVTNTFEGAVFVDQSTADSVQVPDYLSQLFPNFGSKEIKAATKQYAGLGSNIFQVVAIMSESIFICPTYFMLQAFGGRAFKGEFAIPPGNHADDILYYFPTSPIASLIPGSAPPFANPDFVKAFSESFLNFAMSLDTNIEWDPSNITPPWQLWSGSHEMLFNRTEAGAPDIRQIVTPNALLKRCEFWESIGGVTAQ